MNYYSRTSCLLAIVAILSSLAGCGHSSPSQGMAGTEKKTVTIKVVTPERKTLQHLVEEPGAIQPYEETDLFARVPGYIKKLNVDIGQKVEGPRFDSSGKELKKGDVLAEIEVPELQEELKQKQALVRQAVAEVKQANQTLVAAEANVQAIEANVAVAKAGRTRAQALYIRWESELKRISGLVKSGTLDTQTRDEITNQFQAALASKEEVEARIISAQAAVLKAKADRDKSVADVQAAKARVDVAQAEAGRLAAMVSYAKIRAPYDGIVTRRLVNTGDLVQPSFGTGKGLFTISRLDPVRVVVAVPEADAGLVKENAKVKLVISALEGNPPQGTVTRTSWSLTPGTRTLRVEVDLPNKEGKLRPGMYVYAHITTQLPLAWTLPGTAVIKQGGTPVCFLIKDGKTIRTPVQTGKTDGPFIEVLKMQKAVSPLTWEEFTGNEIVAAEAMGLVDGQPVHVEGKSKD